MIQHGFLSLPVPVVFRYPARSRQQVRHVQQLPGVQHAAVVGPVQASPQHGYGRIALRPCPCQAGRGLWRCPGKGRVRGSGRPRPENRSEPGGDPAKAPPGRGGELIFPVISNKPFKIPGARKGIRAAVFAPAFEKRVFALLNRPAQQKGPAADYFFCSRS